VKRFSNILFVAGSGEDDSVALAQAVALANNNQATLTLVDVVDMAPTEMQMAITAVTPAELCDIVAAEKLAALTELAGDVAIAAETKVLVGKPFMEIIREVMANGRDLIIKSVESSQSIEQALFDVTDKKLLRKCPCPVWLIKSNQQTGYREILVALAYEPENPESEALNRQLLEMATSLALSEFSELHVVHAWHLEHESMLRSARLGFSEAEVDEMVLQEERRRREWLTRSVDECIAVQGKEAVDYLKPQLHLLQGHAKKVVIDCANELGAELVVMGTVGRSGIPGLIIGNTAESILAQLDCSVLAVKPAGFVSPVTVNTT
jgi:nucleotide-binding universal stress UspA family protein